MMFKKAIGAALLLTTYVVARAQGPLSDTVTISFPQTIRVGNQTLSAGEYQIRQLPTASNPRLLEFSSNSGTKLEAAITTIAALDNNNQNETSAILEQQGGELFLKYLWIKGKSYGYEIPVDKTRAAVGPAKTMRLTAAYSPSAETQTVAQVQPETQNPAPTPAPAPPQPTPATTADTTPEAQSAPEATAPSATPSPEPTPTPEPVAPSPQTPAPAAELPATATNLAEVALAGLAMTAFGLLISRFDRSPRR